MIWNSIFKQYILTTGVLNFMVLIVHLAHISMHFSALVVLVLQLLVCFRCLNVWHYKSGNVVWLTGKVREFGFGKTVGTLVLYTVTDNSNIQFGSD